MKSQQKGRKAASSSSAAAAPSNDSQQSSSSMRKKSKAMGLEQQCKLLEEENLSLRLQLKVGKETMKQDEQKKDDLLAKIATLTENPALEEELKSALKSYVVRYSDCSSDHAEAVDNHMVQIQRLLAPTKVTKLCLWALNQDEDFFKPVLSPHESLFQIMVDACEATLDQAEEFKNYRHNAKMLTQGLRFTDRECDDLRQRLKRKNRALAEEMHELQDVLSPQQLGKFIVWANKDPRLVEVLKEEWVGWSDPQEEEERRDKHEKQLEQQQMQLNRQKQLQKKRTSDDFDDLDDSDGDE